VSTIWGRSAVVRRGRPGSCHEHELLALSGLGEVLDPSGVASLLDRGFRGWRSSASTGTRRSGTGGPPPWLRAVMAIGWA
jgi:hypothetical protein